MRMMIIEIAVIVLAITQIASFVYLFLTKRRWTLMVGHLLKLSKISLDVSGEQQKLNMRQQEINTMLEANIEILGVHTKLIKPSVAMEAQAFLQWHNRRKEEKNGEI